MNRLNFTQPIVTIFNINIKLFLEKFRNKISPQFNDLLRGLIIIQILIIFAIGIMNVSASQPTGTTITFALRNLSGSPVNVSNNETTFNLFYNNPTSGSPIWNDTYNISTNGEGIGFFFLSNLKSHMNYSQFYYTTKMYGQNEPAKRINITAVPLAFYSSASDNATFSDNAGNATFAASSGNSTFSVFASNTSNSSFAISASGVLCGGVSGAVSNLCTLTDTNSVFNDNLINGSIGAISINQTRFNSSIDQLKGNFSLLPNTATNDSLINSSLANTIITTNTSMFTTLLNAISNFWTALNQNITMTNNSMKFYVDANNASVTAYANLVNSSLADAVKTTNTTMGDYVNNRRNLTVLNLTDSLLSTAGIGFVDENVSIINKSVGKYCLFIWTTSICNNGTHMIESG